MIDIAWIEEEKQLYKQHCKEKIDEFHLNVHNDIAWLLNYVTKTLDTSKNLVVTANLSPKCQDKSQRATESESNTEENVKKSASLTARQTSDISHSDLETKEALAQIQDLKKAKTTQHAQNGSTGVKAEPQANDSILQKNYRPERKPSLPQTRSTASHRTFMDKPKPNNILTSIPKGYSGLELLDNIHYNRNSDEEEDSSDDDMPRQIPDWARTPEITKGLVLQKNWKPEDIFGPIPYCELEALIPNAAHLENEAYKKVQLKAKEKYNRSNLKK